ncbi:hypothetical protein FRC02_000006 [Tulasnella sp. 418]|nr:hypothetical protein FRC02_000006 [Tulasnella sp. 418]
MPGGTAMIGSGSIWDALPPRRLAFPFALVTSLFFLWGFAYGLLDVLNAHFQKVLGITKLQSTGLQVAYFGIGYFFFSPIAGEVLRRKGYKFTILMGLAFYSTGAIFFWPCAKFSSNGKHSAVFGGFVVCTAVIACGLASLETAANSYITVLPGCKPEGAAFRLQFSQSFNGIASFAGPFIASKYFFQGENQNNLNNVQWVYLAVACLGVSVALLVAFVQLPEMSEAELSEQAATTATSSGHADRSTQPLYKQYRLIFGFIAQFCYVGAQVNVATFFINYVTETVHWESHIASNFLSYSLIMFTVSRFVGTAVLSKVNAELVVAIWASLCALCAILAATLKAKSGLAFLMLIFFWEAPLFPCIYVISTTKMGQHTRRASAILISAVGGGAVFPPIQGAIADRYGSRRSYGLVAPAFAYVAFYGLFLWIHHGADWRREANMVDSSDISSEKDANDEKLAYEKQP